MEPLAVHQGTISLPETARAQTIKHKGGGINVDKKPKKQENKRERARDKNNYNGVGG